MKVIHTCPGCGKEYKCKCSKKVIEAARQMHIWAFPCSKKCAARLQAIEAWLRQRGLG